MTAGEESGRVLIWRLSLPTASIFNVLFWQKAFISAKRKRDLSRWWAPRILWLRRAFLPPEFHGLSFIVRFLKSFRLPPGLHIYYASIRAKRRRFEASAWRWMPDMEDIDAATAFLFSLARRCRISGSLSDRRRSSPPMRRLRTLDVLYFALRLPYGFYQQYSLPYRCIFDAMTPQIYSRWASESSRASAWFHFSPM